MNNRMWRHNYSMFQYVPDCLCTYSVWLSACVCEIVSEFQVCTCAQENIMSCFFVSLWMVGKSNHTIAQKQCRIAAVVDSNKVLYITTYSKNILSVYNCVFRFTWVSVFVHGRLSLHCISKTNIVLDYISIRENYICIKHLSYISNIAK